MIADKKILVTGGAGFIGSTLVKGILKLEPDVVRVFDSNEAGLCTLQQNLGNEHLRYLLGDIRDKDRLSRAFEDIDIAFHAAALKHVPICEYNPFDAVQTNVIGTQNVIDISLKEEVESVTVISTDKAANPNNVMGATKLLAERLIVAANYYRGKRKTVLSCVRFGNVIGSTGSVIPLFERQIKQGGPITVTDHNMTRFMMPVKDAVDLILRSAVISKGGEIFIFKMHSVRIIDLAKAMIKKLAPKYGFAPQKIEIKEIGARPGEKNHEELMTENESRNALETGGMFIIKPQLTLLGLDYDVYHPEAKPAEVKGYSSNVNLLSEKEIMEMVR